MEEYQQILKDQFGKLPQTLRDFISKRDWSDAVSNIAKQFNLTEEKRISLENEVLFVLIGLEPPTDLAENMEREMAIDSNAADIIAEEVKKNIFKQVSDEISSMWQSGEQEESKEPQTQSGVGNSFEQIILNQAKAMQPAVPADRIMNHELGIMNEKKEPPNNLPTSEVPHNLPTYKPGEDPYHEPIA